MRTFLNVTLMALTIGCAPKDDDGDNWGSGGLNDTGMGSTADDGNDDGAADDDAGDDGTPDEDGASIFATHCAGCHGTDGTNGSAPDLSQAVPLLSDADLMNVLQNGQNYMPAPELDSSQEDMLFLHLRDLYGEFGGG